MFCVKGLEQSVTSIVNLENDIYFIYRTVNK